MANNEQNFYNVGQFLFGYDSKEKKMAYGKETIFKWHENIPTIEVPLIDNNIENENKSKKLAETKKKTTTKKSTITGKTRKKSDKKDNDEMTH